MHPAPGTGVTWGGGAAHGGAAGAPAPGGAAAIWWGAPAGLLGVQLLATVPWSGVPPTVPVGHVVGGLVMLAAPAAAMSGAVRRHLGGVEHLVITLAGLLTAAAVVAGAVLSRTTGLPGGYHPTSWGWSGGLALVLAVTVLLVHVLRLVLAQRDAARLER